MSLQEKFKAWLESLTWADRLGPCEQLMFMAFHAGHEQARATDLLEACEAMIAAFGYAGTRLVGKEFEAKEQMMAAIKKARGE